MKDSVIQSLWSALQFDPPTQKGQVPDKTHLSKHGARETAKLFAAEVRRAIPEFAELLESP